jgi:hypothetical protein
MLRAPLTSVAIARDAGDAARLEQLREFLGRVFRVERRGDFPRNGSAAQRNAAIPTRHRSRVSHPREKSDAARRDVAVNVIAPAQEDDPVTSRI